MNGQHDALSLMVMPHDGSDAAVTGFHNWGAWGFIETMCIQNKPAVYSHGLY